MKKYTQEEYTDGVFLAFFLGLSVSVVFWFAIRFMETIINTLEVASGWKM